MIVARSGTCQGNQFQVLQQLQQEMVTVVENSGVQKVNNMRCVGCLVLAATGYWFMMGETWRMPILAVVSRVSLSFSPTAPA